ncbi:hypothetical protein, partial [Serratia marcescens]|uniref:hypothetical protein n=1 Tax=Serratia marcescens TaxID=615 RepID=UPI00235FDD75
PQRGQVLPGNLPVKLLAAGVNILMAFRHRDSPFSFTTLREATCQGLGQTDERQPSAALTSPY